MSITLHGSDLSRVSEMSQASNGQRLLFHFLAPVVVLLEAHKLTM